MTKDRSGSTGVLASLRRAEAGDYIFVTNLRQEQETSLGRIIHITLPRVVWMELDIIWVQVYPNLAKDLKFKWGTDLLQYYVKRVVSDNTQKKLIKLLYDY